MAKVFKIDCYEKFDKSQAPAEKKANSRKANVPLFIYMILERQTDKKHPMRQAELIRRLAKMPFEVVIERKALGRHLMSLSKLGMGIHKSSEGYYYEDEFKFEDADVS